MEEDHYIRLTIITVKKQINNHWLRKEALVDFSKHPDLFYLFRLEKEENATGGYFFIKQQHIFSYTLFIVFLLIQSTWEASLTAQ